MVYFQLIRLTGGDNTITFDGGLESSLENPKTLLSILVNVSAYQDNDIQGYLEREKIFDIPDKLLDTVELAGTNNFSKSFNRLNEIEVGVAIPAGSTFKAAIKCGATPTNLVGAYRYEITGA